MDMALRRAETIESKYTIKQKETIVDGKTVPVYQNFTINVAGIENVVVFDEAVGTEGYDYEGKKDELFSKAFKDRQEGFPTEYYLVNPVSLRENRYIIDIEIYPEKIKDSQLLLIQMWDDFARRLQIFGNMNNIDEMKKEYLETSGKPDKIFTSQMYQQLEQEAGESSYNMGSFGKPTIKNAQAMDAGTKNKYDLISILKKPRA